MTLASRAQRLFGQTLDAIVGIAPLIVAAVVASFNDVLGVVAGMAGIGWALFYYFLADGLHGGQSLGKRWLGMRVISHATGAPCTFGQSFVRNVLLALLGPLDWVFIFGPRHQRLGDKAAGTIVVMTTPDGSLR